MLSVAWLSLSGTTPEVFPSLPESELNRKRRYDEYEKMDDYPEITAALDIYADDSYSERS